MDLQITNQVEVKNSSLFINGLKFEGFEIIDKIGAGANAVVLLAQNVLVDRKEALKVWLPKQGDRRNKTKQALLEVRKLAKLDEDCVVKLYNAWIFEGHFIASMEYFNGQTLEKFLIGKSIRQTVYTLFMYLDAIDTTSNLDTFHGDAHSKNVLLKVINDGYEEKLVLKLCDFGTSRFSGKERSFDRHWRIVKETILKFTQSLNDIEDPASLLSQFDQQVNMINADVRDKIISGEAPAFYDARIFTAPLRDYLEHIYFINTKKDFWHQ